MTVTLCLKALDGANPLGYFAALGVLDAVTDRFEKDRGADGDAHKTPRLLWTHRGAWVPSIVFDWLEDETEAKEILIAALREDLKSFGDEPAMELRYKKKEKESKKESKKARKDPQAWDLKPAPEIFRDYVGALVERCAPTGRRSVDYVGVFATETAWDGSGNTKPTALHFTAGTQEFLRMVGELAEGLAKEPGEKHALDESALENAIFGRWRYDDDLPVLQWDATASRDYALRAVNPSDDKKRGEAWAEWLGFRGLRFFRVAPLGTSIRTTGCFGGWKRGGFRWCLWTVPIERATIQSLLQHPDLAKLSEKERKARGIGAVLESKIGRTDQGGYGSFSPASVT